MAKNDFKAFATDRNANVISQEEWEALPALLSGFTAGKASSAQVNKVIRQASFIAAALAQFVSDKTQRDVLDNGDLPGFVELLGSGFAVEYLSRKNPFGDIKSDGTVKTALENLGISNAVIGDGANVIGFSKGVINKPYFRHQDTDTVILLTTQEELSTALDEKQDSNDTLSALANLIATTNKLPYFNNENSADLTDFTKVGRDIIGKSSIHDVIQYLELDDMVTGDGASVIGFSRNDATKPYMRHAQSDSVVALATASQLIGTDQTYQIVTDKYPGITYTNTSKQPWVISLKVNLPASGEVQIKVNGVMAAGGNTPNYAGVSSWVYPCAIVPPGANYMVELSFGNVIEWIELK